MHARRLNDALLKMYSLASPCLCTVWDEINHAIFYQYGAYATSSNDDDTTVYRVQVVQVHALQTSNPPSTVEFENISHGRSRFTIRYIYEKPRMCRTQHFHFLFPKEVHEHVTPSAFYKFVS